MNRETIIEGIYSFIWKNISLAGWIMLGLLGRFSYDLLRSKKFTKTYILGCTGASFVIGCLAGNWFMSRIPADSVVVPIVLATILANNILSAIMSIDWKAIATKNWREAFDILLKNKKE